MTWTSPRTWVAGEKPTAATMNTHIRDNLLELYAGGGGGWTSYTPTIVGSAAPTLDCRYIRTGGKMVTVEVSITLTAVVTANLSMSLPTTAATAMNSALGAVEMLDVSAGLERLGVFEILSGLSTVRFSYENATPARVTAAATTPFTWASGDQIRGMFTYREA